MDAGRERDLLAAAGSVEMGGEWRNQLSPDWSVGRGRDGNQLMARGMDGGGSVQREKGEGEEQGRANGQEA